MNALTKLQTIDNENGEPIFVVLPVSDYKRLVNLATDEQALFPHEVAMKIAIDDKTPIRAWREYKGWSQTNLGEAIGVSQAAIAQMEKPGTNNTEETEQKIADALGISLRQIQSLK